MGQQPSKTISGPQDQGSRTTVALNWQHEDFLLRAFERFEKYRIEKYTRGGALHRMPPFNEPAERRQELCDGMLKALHDHEAVLEMLVGPLWVEGRFVWSPSLTDKTRYNVNDEILLLDDYVWPARYDVAFFDLENGIRFCVWERYDGGEFFVRGSWTIEGDEVVATATVRGPTAEDSRTLLDDVRLRFCNAQELLLRRLDALPFTWEVTYTRYE